MVWQLRARDEAPPPKGMRMDGVSIWWITFSTVWTAILIAGMVFLYTRRKMPILRIRGLPLSFGAVVLLHIYWMAVQWGYTYGHLMPAYVEFWIMGIWMPFGIALFHASNTRFLYVAQAQRRYIHGNGQSPERMSRKKNLVARFRAMDHTARMLLLVSIGMVFQVSLRVTLSEQPELNQPVLLNRHHVPRIQKVPPLLRHQGYRSQRIAKRDQGREWSRLGMVALCFLADLLGMGRRSCHSVAVAWPPRLSGMEIPDDCLLLVQVCHRFHVS